MSSTYGIPNKIISPNKIVISDNDSAGLNIKNNATINIKAEAKIDTFSYFLV